MRPLRAFCIGAAWCLAVAVATVLPFVSASAAERLGRDVVPTFQAIHLVLDPSKADYTGSVQIELEVRKKTDTFSFHAQEMKLNKVVLRKKDGLVNLKHEGGERGLVKVKTETALLPGAYTLEVDFSNNFDTRTTGLFKVEAGGQAYAFTQFEPDDARKAFPCWDEPAFKIPFQVTVVVPQEHVAVSNTPVLKESVASGSKTVVFQRTKPLPSYLVAIATGPLDTVPVPGMSVPGRVVALKGQGRLTGEAVKMTPPVLQALEKYFGRPYPYEKLDLIAIPGFGGAMENAGAVTFGDNILLLDSERATVGQRRGLAATLTHELAHMWFGDLVTMEWWDDVWLNESFASWMGDKVAHEVYPQFNVDVGEIGGAEAAMRTDARLSTRAMRQPVSADDNLMQSFDELAYPKGQRVLGMFEQWMGPATFRKGVLDYLQAHEWRNAVAADLWRSLSRAAGKDVSAPMSTFLDQGGVPLVTAEILPGGQVRLSQKRFLNYGVKEPGPTLWQIPVTLKFPDGNATKTQSVLLTKATDTVRLSTGRAPAWVHPNAAESGYYRWKVSPDVLVTMARESARILDARERVGFIGNLSALLDAGAIEGSDYLRALEQFADDPHPGVISALLNALGKVKQAFFSEGRDGLFAGYVRKTLGPAVKRFGLSKASGEPEAVSLLRPRLIAWLADEGKDEKILERAESLAKAYLADPSSVDPSLAGAALRLSAFRGDSALFEQYKKRFETSQVPAERGRYLAALGSFRDPALAQKALRYAVEGPLRPTELFNIPFTVGSAPQKEDIPFAWMVENFDKLTKRLPPFFLTFMPGFAGGCSAKRLEAARAFFAEPAHKAAGTEKELAKVAEAVTDCVGLREREGRAVAEYLKQSAEPR